MPKAQANATAAGLSRIPRLASQPSPGFTTARRRVQRCCTGHATAAFGATSPLARVSAKDRNPPVCDLPQRRLVNGSSRAKAVILNHGWANRWRKESAGPDDRVKQLLSNLGLDLPGKRGKVIREWGAPHPVQAGRGDLRSELAAEVRSTHDRKNGWISPDPTSQAVRRNGI
jgi:hypothetical protein